MTFPGTFPGTSPDPHLGESAAALVDGELGHAARDRALGHVTRCAACRAEVDAQRRLKATLSGLGAPPVPAGLSDRLLDLARASEPGGDRRPPGAGAATPAGPLPWAPRMAAFAPGGRAAARPGGRRRPAAGPTRRQAVPAVRTRRLARATPRLLGAGAAAVAVGLVGTLLLGGNNGARVQPPVDTFGVDHAQTVSDPFGNAVSTVVTVRTGR